MPSIFTESRDATRKPRWRARKRYCLVVQAFRRIGEAHLLVGRICTADLEAALHRLVTAPERPEVNRTLLHLESFCRFLRRNRRLIHAELRREP